MTLVTKDQEESKVDGLACIQKAQDAGTSFPIAQVWCPGFFLAFDVRAQCCGTARPFGTIVEVIVEAIVIAFSPSSEAS
jgi:hypothetical protein